MSYGRCPKCGDDVISRERRPDGNDKCTSGCVFPTRETLEPISASDGAIYSAVSKRAPMSPKMIANWEKLIDAFEKYKNTT